MITIDMVMNYINTYKRNPHNEKHPVCLTNPQIKFLENLCAGKITSTPRNFGKTWLIKMYCDALDFYHDIEKYEDYIKADEVISMKETMDGWNAYSVNVYADGWLVEAYKENPEKFCSEYNATPEDIERIKKWIEFHGDLRDS
jgi:hypothetical protein